MKLRLTLFLPASDEGLGDNRLLSLAEAVHETYGEKIPWDASLVTDDFSLMAQPCACGEPWFVLEAQPVPYFDSDGLKESLATDEPYVALNPQSRVVSFVGIPMCSNCGEKHPSIPDVMFMGEDDGDHREG